MSSGKSDNVGDFMMEKKWQPCPYFSPQFSLHMLLSRYLTVPLVLLLSSTKISGFKEKFDDAKGRFPIIDNRDTYRVKEVIIKHLNYLIAFGKSASLRGGQ